MTAVSLDRHLWPELYCRIVLYFWAWNYICFLLLSSVYDLWGWNTSSSPPLLCPVSPPHPSPSPPPHRCPPLFFLAKTTSPYWSCRQRHKHKLATSGSSPHDRDSLGGWKKEFKNTDKCSFIATYLKQLITYGRWCGIFCLWTNSVVLFKLPIWPSPCITVTLVALHWHVLWARCWEYSQAKRQGASSSRQEEVPWPFPQQPPQTFCVQARKAPLFLTPCMALLCSVLRTSKSHEPVPS